MSGDRVTVILADGHPVVLSGLTTILAAIPDLEIVALVREGVDAAKALRELRPKMAILDMNMPNLNSLIVIQLINRLDTKAILFTSSPLQVQIVSNQLSGAAGVLLKTTELDSLLHCVQYVMAGGRWISPEVIQPPRTGDVATPMRCADAIQEGLTAREHELTALVAEGLSNKHIARKLKICEGTVKIHLHNIYGKLGIPNRTSLATLAQRQF